MIDPATTQKIAAHTGRRQTAVICPIMMPKWKKWLCVLKTSHVNRKWTVLVIAVGPQDCTVLILDYQRFTSVLELISKFLNLFESLRKQHTKISSKFMCRSQTLTGEREFLSLTAGLFRVNILTHSFCLQNDNSWQSGAGTFPDTFLYSLQERFFCSTAFTNMFPVNAIRMSCVRSYWTSGSLIRMTQMIWPDRY